MCIYRNVSFISDAHFSALHSLPSELYKNNQKEVLFYQNNIQNSIYALTDESGSVVESYSYDIYGKRSVYDANGVLSDTSIVGNEYGFTGRRYDDETGLYYFRARYYSPDLGRFISRDPLTFVDGMNMYAGYFALRGVTDPSGLATVRVTCSGGKTKEYVDPGNEALRDALNNYPDGSIENIEFVGHANKNEIGTDSDNGSDGLVNFGEDGGVVWSDTAESFADTVRDKLSDNASIELNGCNSAREGWGGGDENISKQLSRDLSDTSVTGNRGYAFSNEVSMPGSREENHFRIGSSDHAVGIPRTYENGQQR